jgi:hypothetical protein
MAVAYIMGKGGFTNTDITPPDYKQGASDMRNFLLSNPSIISMKNWEQNDFLFNVASTAVAGQSTLSAVAFRWPDNYLAMRSSNYAAFCSYMQGAYDYMVCAKMTNYDPDNGAVNRIQAASVSISGVIQNNPVIPVAQAPTTTAQVAQMNQAVAGNNNGSVPSYSDALNPGTATVPAGQIESSATINQIVQQFSLGNWWYAIGAGVLLILFFLFRKKKK